MILVRGLFEALRREEREKGEEGRKDLVIGQSRPMRYSERIS